MNEHRQNFESIRRYYVPNNRLPVKERRAGIRRFLRQNNKLLREWKDKMNSAINESKGV